jgi:multimeric flavodoxin WrbA
MKITAIVGSPNDAKSNTAALITDFFDNLKEINPAIETELISLGKMNITPCLGCWACMKTGKCVLKDDIAAIQEKLFASDLVIFASPVYVHQISGQMKTFIDRMFIWVHTMKLLGKPAITAIATAQTGVIPVKNYLEKVARFMGMITVGSMNARAYRPGVFPKRGYYKEKHVRLAKKVNKILEGKRPIFPNLKNMIYFHALQFTYRTMPQHLPYEHEYWKNKKWYGKTIYQAIKMEKENDPTAAPSR